MSARGKRPKYVDREGDEAMLGHPRHLLAVAAVAVAGLTRPASALAFDDKDFCVTAEQFALAANKDIGVWIDRATRNAGVQVSCTTKVVQFKRFSYTPSASMDTAWKEVKAQEWSAYQCNSRLWQDAIRNGWKVELSVTTADRAQVSLNAQCK